jgi:hypothetical protein
MTSKCSFLFTLPFISCLGLQPMGGVVEKMQREVESLDENKNFTFVDLGLSDEDLNLIDQFKVRFTDQYDCFGDLDLLQDELSAFLRSMGNNDEHAIQRITQIIREAADRVIRASGKETAWVCVRTSTPNREFDLPRWHWDGYYYPPYSGFAFKFAAVLKGNPTLFHQLTKDSREVFESHFEDREFLSNFLAESLIESAKPGEGAFFLVGDRDSAAAHSEPKMDCERLFFSVLPGHASEIDELTIRRNPTHLKS